MEISNKILEEGKQIVEWVENKGIKLVSAVLFGSAARGFGKPNDLDIILVVDENPDKIDKLCREFRTLDLTLTKKYGFYPELTILGKDYVGKGNTLFYYSIIRDGITLKGNKDLFVSALLNAEGRQALEKAIGVERAYSFLKHAEKDIKEAKDVADLQLAAEGAYRACVEAMYALLRKHGMPLPSNHEEEREKLQTIDEIYTEASLSSRYYVLFEHLHGECFYHGECANLREWISKAKEFIDSIAKLI